MTRHLPKGEQRKILFGLVHLHVVYDFSCGMMGEGGGVGSLNIGK